MLMDGNFTVKWTVTEKISFFVGVRGRVLHLNQKMVK